MWRSMSLCRFLKELFEVHSVEFLGWWERALPYTLAAKRFPLMIVMQYPESSV